MHMKSNGDASSTHSSTIRKRALRIIHLCVFAFVLAIVAQYHKLLGLWGSVGVPLFVGLIMILQYLHAMAKIDQDEMKKARTNTH